MIKKKLNLRIFEFTVFGYHLFLIVLIVLYLASCSSKTKESKKIFKNNCIFSVEIYPSNGASPNLITYEIFISDTLISNILLKKKYKKIVFCSDFGDFSTHNVFVTKKKCFIYQIQCETAFFIFSDYKESDFPEIIKKMTNPQLKIFTEKSTLTIKKCSTRATSKTGGVTNGGYQIN